MTAPARCPVCRARLRDTAECLRCGADLRPLILLAERARRLRESSRDAIMAGRYEEAAEFAAESSRLRRTPQGVRLAILAEWLRL